MHIYGVRVYQWHQNQNRQAVAIRRTVKDGTQHKLVPEGDPMRYTVNIDATDIDAIGRAVVEACYPVEVQ